MTIEYAHALVSAEKFGAELEKLSAAERITVLGQFLDGLSFCRYCGYNGCDGSCENDE